eukprot:CAMPEP_0177266398 /NCGR_PEP_ID=MMETSP0367-20130122/62659_1 /TAXON_ID=447022 ORGANISM="Scrippsiella hangoei-like, Strain SHHI-4" /NCGR_SAMPLE_ID=MMETSP0367 /ASSEMBLY_ACC=CAM_ASM_000362 /LENGTH=51 /DNA_ID=CAMNT_0018721757 /DNA_START=398 /DNA_END=549 /DNA_ORIENTATION=-
MTVRCSRDEWSRAPRTSAIDVCIRGKRKPPADLLQVAALRVQKQSVSNGPP